MSLYRPPLTIKKITGFETPLYHPESNKMYLKPIYFSYGQILFNFFFEYMKI